MIGVIVNRRKISKLLLGSVAGAALMRGRARAQSCESAAISKEPSVKYVESSATEITRHQAELRAWLDGASGPAAAAVNRAQIAKYVDSGGQLEFLHMSSSLASLPVFVLATGVRRVVGRQPDGWSSCRDAAQMLFLWWRGIRARAKKEKLDLSGANIGQRYYAFAHAALLSMAIADRATADWCAEAALAMTADGIAASSVLPTDITFPLWVASVSAAWLGVAGPATNSGKDGDIFSLIEQRRDDSAVAKLLPVLLDYHLWRCDTREKSRNPDASYQYPGLALLPTVAYAIAALRRKEGAEALPAIHHPLVSLPTWNPPSDVVPVDPLIASVTRRTLRIEAGSY